MSFFMQKEKFILYLSLLLTSIVVTLFISSFVTFMSLNEKSVFLSVWPLNWFYAILIAFPALIIFRPICIQISKKLVTFFLK